MIFHLRLLALFLSQPLTLKSYSILTVFSGKRHPRAFVRSRNVFLHAASSAPGSATSSYHQQTNNGSDTDVSWYNSHIRMIKCFNLGGMVQSKRENLTLKQDGDTQAAISHSEEDIEVTIPLGENPNFIVITGETGSGKSMLVTKVISLILGGKVTGAMIPRSSYAFGEVTLKLSEPHLSIAYQKLLQAGLDPILLSFDHDGMAEITLRRTISSNDLPSSNKKSRIKSISHVNGKLVTTKILRTISSSFLAIVDAAVASSALSRPESIMKMIDVGVSSLIKARVKETKGNYYRARKKREEIMRQLENRIMPSSYVLTGSVVTNENTKLLQHFIDELDDFEKRVHSFRDKIKLSPSIGRLFATSKEGKERETIAPNDLLLQALVKFLSSTWFNEATGDSIASSLYTTLIDLKEALKTLDARVAAARSACETLSSLSSKSSVIVALETTRNFLYDAGGDSMLSSGVANELTISIEKSHDLLNGLEDALRKCSHFFEDDSKGLLASLERMRTSVDLSVDECDQLITDWGTLARKHGVTPYFLPSCHQTLRQELDGNVEYNILLPQAEEAESDALRKFESACHVLSDARRSVCRRLSDSVTERLPSLGMDGSMFVAQLNSTARQCTDFAAFAPGAILGLDSIELLLSHNLVPSEEQHIDGDQSNRAGKTNSVLVESNHHGGSLYLVGSSGEKARILLAIETTLPGSVGTLTVDSDDVDEESKQDVIPLVAVLYDEIDAHVGGRAVIALGKMLTEQTRGVADHFNGVRKRGQIIAITHNPSLAAVADRHIVVHKLSKQALSSGKAIEVLVRCVEGLDRTKELARMASGDIATEEAEVFARALLRDSLATDT